MINYPNSACEKHKSVSTSEPVCIICMSNQITELELENSALKDGLEVQNDALHAKLIEVEEEVVRLNKEIDLRHRIHIDLCDTINPERDAPAKDAAIALHAKLKAAEELNVDYEECNADRNRLVREIDTIINGDNAAKQASLCDLVPVIRELVSKLTDAEVRIAKLEKENRDDSEADRAMRELLMEELDADREDGRFCGRSRYWLGHDTMHPFVEPGDLFK